MPQEAPQHEILFIGQTVKNFYETEDFVDAEDGSGNKVKKSFGVIEFSNGIFLHFELNKHTQIGIPEIASTNIN